MKLYFKRDKPKKKWTKHQRTERHNIKGVDTKAKIQVCNIRIIEIINEREDIEAQQEIKSPYECVIKLVFLNFNIFINFYWDGYLRRYVPIISHLSFEERNILKKLIIIFEIWTKTTPSALKIKLFFFSIKN